MTPLVLGVAIGITLAVALGLYLLVRFRATSNQRRHTIRVTSRGRSADEALVRVSVEAEVSLPAPTPSGTSRRISDELDAALRSCLATRRLLALPGVGDHLSITLQVPGVQVHRVTVTAADVEVTRELRRLVGGP